MSIEKLFIAQKIGFEQDESIFLVYIPTLHTHTHKVGLDLNRQNA